MAQNLQKKLSLPIMFILILGISTAGYLIGSVVATSQYQLLDEGIESLSLSLSSDVEDFFIQLQDQLTWESRKGVYQILFSDVADEDGRMLAQKELMTLADRDRRIGELRITNATGWVIASSSEVRNLYVGDRDYFISAVNGVPAVSNVILSRTTGRPVLCVAVPFYSSEQLGVAGVFYTPIDYEEFCRIIVDDVQIGEGSYAFVADANGRIAAHPDRSSIYSLNLNDLVSGPDILSHDRAQFRYELNGLERVARYFKDPGTGWISVVTVEVRSYFAQIRRIRNFIILAMSITLMLIGLTVTSTIRGMVKSIRSLAEESDIIATGRFDLKLSCDYSIEFRTLATSFQTVLDALNDKVTEVVTAQEEGKHQASRELSVVIDLLKSKKAEAEDSVEALKAAQTQMLEIEKQASLGRLVSGVAHEINTPLGISVTSVTFVEDHITGMLKNLGAGTWDPSDAAADLEVMKDGILSARRNLMRAAELVRNFKQIAADQSSEQLRVFELREYIEEILQSISPRLKRTNHSVELDNSADIVMRSYPGALMQLFTNLIENSVIHGFNSMKSGKIFIGLKTDGDFVEITYSDNGEGMDEDTITKIYDPFFTTNRTRGGTGLGMHVSYNLVTRTLAGTLACDSRPGEGVRFTVRIPKIIEEPTES